MERRRSGTERLIMTKRLWLQGMRCVCGLAVAAAVLAPQAAQAQITRVSSSSDQKQAIGFNLGYFALLGEDSRTSGDVLVTDLDSLAFNIKDFNGFTFGGEYLIGLGDYIEAGAGVSYYQHTVPSVYRNFVNTNGAEIQQELKLRIIPFSATVRFLPIGRNGVAPYVGGGLGVFNWRYTETGEFVDFDDNSVFRNSYKADGTAVGPVFLAGLRAPVGPAITIGGEVRYQKAVGDTKADEKPPETRLLDNKIDLGGWTTSFTFHFKF
jgi:hypothetical protein